MTATSLYIIKCEEYLKIGVSSRPLYRMGSFYTGNPFELSLLYQNEMELRHIARLAEKIAHERLHEHHERLEWFSCNVRTAIAACDEACAFAINKFKEERVSQREKALNLIKNINAPLLSKISDMPESRLREINDARDFSRDEYLKICKGVRALT